MHSHKTENWQSEGGKFEPAFFREIEFFFFWKEV